MSDHEALRRWAGELRSLLARGGDHFTGEAAMFEPAPGRLEVSLRLARPLRGDARSAAKTLIFEHAACHSWRVRKTRVFRTHVCVEVTASSPRT